MAGENVIYSNRQHYHQLTRTHTVLTGRKTPMLLQSPCQYTKYCLRAFHCLNAFLLRQNCCAPDSDGFLCDFCFLSRRCVVTHQDEKGKKRQKDMLSGVCALVNWWYWKQSCKAELACRISHGASSACLWKWKNEPVSHTHQNMRRINLRRRRGYPL